MLVATSFMSLASIRDVIKGVGLTSVIVGTKTQISVKPEKIEGDTAEDLAEIYAPAGAISCRSIVGEAAREWCSRVDCRLWAQAHCIDSLI